jgi:transmembrane sensor
MIAADDTGMPLAELEEQARAWLRLLTSGAATQDDAAGFRRWLHAGPRHKAAYASAKSQWDAISASARTWEQTAPAVKANPPRRQPASRYGRRAFLGAGMAGAAAIVYPPLGLWPSPSAWGSDYRTATGEQRTVALGDQTTVTLNTQTAIRRQAEQGRTTGFDLVTGEAAVDMTGVSRLFTVTAGAGRSEAEYARFEVRNVDGKVCVTCIEGSVRVTHPAGVRMLSAREQAIYDSRNISDTASVDPASATAWRNGMLVLHDMPLGDVIDEINRYRSGRVVLMNDAVRGKRVNGSFPIASMDQTLWQLERIFGLRSRSLGGVLVLT